MSDRPVIVYVAGSGRSGSTLLEGMLLQAVPAIAVGELCYIWERSFGRNERCSCGEQFRECPFWQQVMQVAFGGMDAVPVDDLAQSQAYVYRMRNIPLLRLPALRPPALRRHLARIRDAYSRIHCAVAEVAEVGTVIDSSKFATHGYVLRDLTEGDLRVVHLVRDSRAVAYSWQRVVRRPEAIDTEQYMATFDARTSAVIWLQDNVFCGGLRRDVQRSVLTRYEDLVTAPEELGRVLDILGLPSGGELNPAAHLRHSVSGNPSRLTSGERPVRIDQAWMTQLSAVDSRTVTRLTAPLLMRYGYPLKKSQTRRADGIARDS